MPRTSSNLDNRTFSSPLTPEDAFGRVVRERRLFLGLTQTDLEGEEGDGLERSYISRIESGKTQVCLRGILHLAKVLQMEPDVLMKEVTERMVKGT